MPPVGRALANTKTFILHPRTLQLLPIGAIGEIFVGGAGVARGYINIPFSITLSTVMYFDSIANTDLSKDKFINVKDIGAGSLIKTAFTNPDQARLYRTGDLGRLLSDGSVQCLGRVDSQVKMRGYP